MPVWLGAVLIGGAWALALGSIFYHCAKGWQRKD